MKGRIRQRSANSWELSWDMPADGSGKRLRRFKNVKGGRKDAERELRRILRELDTGSYVEPSKLTLGRFLSDWLGEIEVSATTLHRYKQLVEGYLVPALGGHVLSRLTPAQIDHAYAGWKAEGRRDGKPGGLSPRTRLHLHRVLMTALKAAVRKQLLARNPAEAANAPKIKERFRPAMLTPDQANRLLDGLAHTRLHMPVLLALATGMRRGEILAVRWRDIRGSVLQVERSLAHVKEKSFFKEPKSGKPRSVTLPAFALEGLAAHRKKQAEELLKLGVRQTAETLVCCRYDGKPLHPLSLTHEFSRLVKGMKDVPRIRFHDLRHSHASALLAANVHPKIVQERLGHSTIAITMDLYSHVTETLQEDAASRLDAAFRPAITGGRK